MWLMTGYMMDCVWSENEATQDSLTEVNRSVSEGGQKIYSMLISDCELVQKSPSNNENLH